jgi:hypothetical protein
VPRKLGRPLRFGEVLAGALLFELAFGLWVGVYLILESTVSSHTGREEPEIALLIYLGLWLVAGVSAFVALIGVVLAGSLTSEPGHARAALVALLAGTLFSMGWLVVYVVGAIISKAIAESDVVSLAMFWSYLLVGPLLAFGLSVKLLAKMSRRVPTAAV